MFQAVGYNESFFDVSEAPAGAKCDDYLAGSHEMFSGGFQGKIGLAEKFVFFGGCEAGVVAE